MRAKVTPKAPVKPTCSQASIPPTRRPLQITGGSGASHLQRHREVRKAARRVVSEPYIMGHSDGGIIALTLAARYPDIPGAIISCGANTSPKTMKPYFIIGVKFNNMFHHDKLNDMMLTLPDITAEMLGEITAPTYIVAGEHDIMWLSDTAYMYRKIPNSRIAIIKGAGHSTYMSHDGKQAYVLAKGFFDTL